MERFEDLGFELIVDFFRSLTQDVFESSAFGNAALGFEGRPLRSLSALQVFPSVTMSNGSLRPRATISCKNPFQFANRILRYQHRYGEELASEHQYDSLWQRGWALSSLLPGGKRKNVPSSSRYDGSSSLERSRLRNTSKSSDRHCVTRLTTDFDTPVPLRTSANVASMSTRRHPVHVHSSDQLIQFFRPTHKIRIENLRTKTCRCLSNLRHLDRHRSFAGENSMRFIPVTTAFLLRRLRSVLVVASTQRFRHFTLQCVSKHQHCAPRPNDLRQIHIPEYQSSPQTA